MPKIAAGATNKNISIAPHGTGKVVVGTGAADATVQSDGDHNLILQTGNSTTSKIEINDGANGDVAITPNGTGNLTIDNIAISDNTIKSTDTNGNIDLTPNGTGEVNISKVDIDSGAIDGTTIATSDVTVGSGKTLDVSAGSLTSSTAQKQAIVDGADIEGEDILSTGESGTFLGADGDDSSSWQTIAGTLPDQADNANKILTTDATDASWTATRKLLASTDGIQRSDATAVLSEDGSNVATLDNVSLGNSVAFPAGHVLQVVSTLHTAGASVAGAASNAFASFDTPFSKAITTSVLNSKILILCHMAVYSGAGGVMGKLYRGETPIAYPPDSELETNQQEIPHTVFRRSAGTQYAIDTYMIPVIYLDSPAVVKDTLLTYEIRVSTSAQYSSAIYLNRTSANSDVVYYPRPTSSFTLMEVA
jgi:hypothetical protein